MTTLLVDFDCIFERSIGYGVDEIESVLEQYAYVYQNLSEAAEYAHAGGSDLKRIWVWSNDTDQMLREFPDGPPEHIDIRQEVAKLRTFLERTRSDDYYKSRLYADAESAILEWESAGLDLIFVGEEPSTDRMRTALRKAGVLQDYACRKITIPDYESIRKILAEFDIDQDSSAFVGRSQGLVRSLARNLRMVLIQVQGNRSALDSGVTKEWLEVDSLSEVLSAFLPSTHEPKH